jgi:hypothetical protein
LFSHALFIDVIQKCTDAAAAAAAAAYSCAAVRVTHMLLSNAHFLRCVY